MKKIIFTLFAALVVQAQAFTLDFTAYNGTSITSGSPLIVPVAGYGNVRFEAVGLQTLTVNTQYAPGVTLAIEKNETLIVTFLGVYPPYDINDVSFGFNGLSGIDGLVITPIDSTSVQISMTGATGNGAGLRDVTWGAVPEPSTSLLGAVSVLAIALRRRRA